MSSALLKVSALEVRARARGGMRLLIKSPALRVAAGSVVGIIGPNGSGKTTFLRFICGLMSGFDGTKRGKIKIEDQPLGDRPGAGRARLVGYMGADWSTEFPITVREAVGLVGGDVERALRETECSELTDRMVPTLSGGERQRVGLALMRAQKPKVMALDEAFSKMDPDYQSLFSQRVRSWTTEESSVTFVVAHDLNWIRATCTHLLSVLDGHVISFGPIETEWGTELLTRLFPRAEWGGLAE